MNSPRRLFTKLTLHFDLHGRATFRTITRNDVLKMVQKRSDMTFNGVMSDQSTQSSTASSASVSYPHRPRQHAQPRVDIPKIHMRDIRKLDDVFATTNEPTLTVRQHAILMNADPLRAVILRDACVIFLPDGADGIVSELKANFHAKLQEPQVIAFEFAALEAILATSCSVVALECCRLLPQAKGNIEHMLGNERLSTELDMLRGVKNMINELDTQVQGLRRMLINILDNDEDLHMLYLTKLFNQPNLLEDLFAFDSEDAESLLEVYLQEVYGTQTRVSLMSNQIHNTESIVMLKLDSKRNYLLAVEVTLMLMSMLIAIPTFVVGAFGMNLTSSLEKAEYWFYVVVALCIVCPIVAYWSILAYFRRHGIQLSWKY